jgi:glutamyl-tRNA reductase
MAILALGVSYRRAGVDLLERLAFAGEDYAKAYRRVLEMEAVREAVLLSTCNRVEVYAEVPSYHAGFQDLKRFLAESREVGPEEFAEPLYAHYEGDAAEHLFAVAAGADSMVMGEPQILTQVRAAYRRAEDERAIGPTLSALFRGAVRTGRRARAETAIGGSPSAMVEAGLGLARGWLGTLAGLEAAVVGAGGMAALAVDALRAAGVDRLRIVNRSPERARRLADRAGGEAFGLDRLAATLAGADLIVSSTGASGTVIGPGQLAGRDVGRRLFVLDLAMPRDVEPAVAAMAGVRVADIDSLREALSGGDEATAAALADVRLIVAEEVERFEAWRRASRLAPLIQALRDRGERVAAAELDRSAPKLAGLDEGEHEAVEALARSIVAKLLHDPIVRLKERQVPGAADALARSVAELFGIAPPGQS